MIKLATINNTKHTMTRICRLVISFPVLAAGNNFWHIWSQICIITHLKNNRNKGNEQTNKQRTTDLKIKDKLKH